MSAHASICPKCGSGNVRGPRYVRDVKGERLNYTCGSCGFVQQTPTRDAKSVRA